MLVVGGHNTVVLGGEAARLANTLASRSEQAARASPKGSLRLLCADGAGVLGFVHESALFHGRKGSWEEFVHGIGLFRGWRGCFGVFVHEKALFHGRKGFEEEFVHEIGLFRGRRECFGVFVHENALFHGQTAE